MYGPDEDNESLHREASLEQAEFEEQAATFGQDFSPFVEDANNDEED